MNYLRFMLFALGAATFIGSFQTSTPDDQHMLMGLAMVLIAAGYGLHRFMTRGDRDRPLKAPPHPAPQLMPAPPPSETSTKPDKPSEPPTYGTGGYRWRVGFFFVHSLIHFVLSGFKGFAFATALVAVWLLPQLPEEHMKDGLFAFFFVVLASAGVAVLPWLTVRWFLWPISEPVWPARPVPAPQPETPANPVPKAPQAPMTAPAPPPLQKPTETMVSASTASPPQRSNNDPKNPDLQRWTRRF